MRLDILARDWLGVPYQHQGRTRHGVDCVGLVKCVAESHPSFQRYAIYDLQGYSQDPHDGLLEERLNLAFGSPFAAMSPGDVVAIAFPRAVRHVAIVGEHPNGGLSLIHCYSAVGRVVEHGIDAKWANRIRLIYRPESISYG